MCEYQKPTMGRKVLNCPMASGTSKPAIGLWKIQFQGQKHLQLDSMILMVFSNLNDSTIL